MRSLPIWCRKLPRAPKQEFLCLLLKQQAYRGLPPGCCWLCCGCILTVVLSLSGTSRIWQSLHSTLSAGVNTCRTFQKRRPFMWLKVMCFLLSQPHTSICPFWVSCSDWTPWAQDWAQFGALLNMAVEPTSHAGLEVWAVRLLLVVLQNACAVQLPEGTCLLSAQAYRSFLSLKSLTGIQTARGAERASNAPFKNSGHDGLG